MINFEQLEATLTEGNEGMRALVETIKANQNDILGSIPAEHRSIIVRQNQILIRMIETLLTNCEALTESLIRLGETANNLSEAAQ